jgi:hypothetical protein
VNGRAVLDRHPWAEHHEGFDGHALSEDGVFRQEHGLWRDHGYADRERRPAQHPLGIVVHISSLFVSSK